MVSERMRRQLETLLDEAEAAVARREWDAVAETARAALAIDSADSDALWGVKTSSATLRGVERSARRER